MSPKGEWLLDFGIATVIATGLIAAPRLVRGSAQTISVLGSGRGIDHVVIAVRDLEEATRAYTAMLGFSVSRGAGVPGGFRHSMVFFGTTYLELLSADPSRAAPDKTLAEFSEQREGAHALALDVSSAQQTADFLRARSFDVMGPESSSFVPEGSKEVRTPLWQTVAITKPILPPGGIFFIQYAPRESGRKPPEQPNTAVGIHSVWVAVRDRDAATKAYESIGLLPGREMEMPQLAAAGREIGAGKGVILLLQASDKKGPLASYIARYGEAIVGMSIEVRGLEVARSLIRASTKRELDSYGRPYGRAVLVAPEFTHGVWMELFQRTSVENPLRPTEHPNRGEGG